MCYFKRDMWKGGEEAAVRWVTNQQRTDFWNLLLSLVADTHQLWLGNGSNSHQETITPSVQLTPVFMDAGTWQELNGWEHHQLGLGTKTLASLGVLRPRFCNCCRNSQVPHIRHRWLCQTPREKGRANTWLCVRAGLRHQCWGIPYVRGHAVVILYHFPFQGDWRDPPKIGLQLFLISSPLVNLHFFSVLCTCDAFFKQIGPGRCRRACLLTLSFTLCGLVMFYSGIWLWDRYWKLNIRDNVGWKWWEGEKGNHTALQW